MSETIEIPSATLPVELTDGLNMHPVEARSLGELFSADYADYADASPFPHIVLEDFATETAGRQVVANLQRGERKSDGLSNAFRGGARARRVVKRIP